MKECKEGAYIIEYMSEGNWKECPGVIWSYTELSLHKILNMAHLQNVAQLTG